MLIVWLVFYLLIFLLLLIVLTIFIPFEYYASGEKYDETNLAIELSWLLGAIRAAFTLRTGSGVKYYIRLFGFKINKENFKKTDAGKDAVKEMSKGTEKKENKKIVKFPDRDFIFKTISFIKSVFNRIKPYQLEIDGKYGFDEPYNTAILYSIASLFRGREKSDKINAVPVFDEEILEGRFLVKGRIIPGLIILQAAGYLLSKPVRKIIFN